MPEHRMIDVPEVDFMAVTENVTDWQIGKRVVIRRPKHSIALGCGVVLALPILGLVVAGLLLGNLESLYFTITVACMICAGLFAVVVIPFNFSNRARETVIDWSTKTISFGHGIRSTTFPFSDIRRVCVQTKQRAGEPPRYDGSVDVDVAGRMYPLFELLPSAEDQNKPCDTLYGVAQRLAETWSVPCEVFLLGNRVEDEALRGRSRSPEEVAKKYTFLGSMASGNAMSADYRGKADEAAEYREEAIFYYKQANKIDPTSEEPLLAIGRLSQDDAHREMAANAVLKLNPNSIPALIERGQSLMLDGREEEGFATLTKAVENDPSLTTYSARGNAYLLSERFPEAHADFSEAIALAPQDADNYSARGECLKDWYEDSPDDDLFRRALADFDEAIRLDGDDTTYRIERAKLLMAAERFDDAIAAFSQVVAASPDSFYAYSQRGQAYLDSGHRAKEAERDFARAVELLEKQPRTTDSAMRRTQLMSIAFAYRARAEARRQLGRLKQADDDIQRAIALQGEADG